MAGQLCIHKDSGKNKSVFTYARFGTQQRFHCFGLKRIIYLLWKESLGSFYHEQHTGTFKIGVFIFNGNKIMTTGGGGMIVTNDEMIAKKAKHLTTIKVAASVGIHS